MRDESINGAELFHHLFNHAAIFHGIGSCAITGAMGGCIKSDHFISFCHKGLHIGFKFMGRRSKSMKDQYSFCSGMIPAIPPNGDGFSWFRLYWVGWLNIQQYLYWFSVMYLAQGFWMQQIGCAKQIKCLLSGFFSRKKA